VAPPPTRCVCPPSSILSVIAADRIDPQAMKAYNDHCEKNGKPDSHAEAKGN
jgi:hypothetical protein